MLVAEAWVPSAARAQVAEVLRGAANRSANTHVGGTAVNYDDSDL